MKKYIESKTALNGGTPMYAIFNNANDPLICYLNWLDQIEEKHRNNDKGLISRLFESIKTKLNKN